MSACPTFSAALRGSTCTARQMVPAAAGTKTSKRSVRRASTIASATSSGSTTLTARVSFKPEPSSVLTTPGHTTESSIPVPRSSARRASERPTTANFVVQ